MRFSFTKLILMALVLGIPIFGYFAWSAFGGTVANKTLSANVSLEDGLVGHWTFDGKDMLTNVADVSGQGNDGVLVLGVSGNTATTTAAGRMGQGLVFDGVGDYVDTNARVLDSSPTAFTMSAWVYLDTIDTTGGAQIVIAESLSGSLTWGIYFHETAGSGNRFQFSVNSAVNSVGADNAAVKGVWYHLVGVYDSTHATEKETFYIDGVKQAATGNVTASVIGSHQLMLGARDNASLPLDGTLDDVRIYNRALSPEEISRLYDLGATTHVNKTLAASSDVTSGLVGHWTFDGKDLLTNVADVSGQGNDGALQGQTSTTTAVGRIGQALDFDGTNDYVLIPDDASLNLTTSFTVAAWIYWDTDAAPFDGIYNSGTNTNRWRLSINNLFKLTFTEAVIADYTGTNTINKGRWYHVAAVKDGDSGTNLRLYVNAVFDSSHAVGTVQTPSGSKEIARIQESNSFAFNGKIDDVRIYNRALSQAELERIYELGNTTHVNQTLNTNPDLESGLAGHWTFDGPDVDIGGNQITDRSTNANHGAMVGMGTGITVTPGRLGQAMDLDGSDDYLNVADPADGSLDFGTGDFSVSVWVYAEGYANNGSSLNTIAGKHDNSMTGWALYILSDNKPRFNAMGGTTFTNSATGASALNDGRWHHLVGIKVGGGAPSLYVDGVKQTDGVANSNSASSSFRFRVGADENTLRTLNGKVDDVRVYSRALSPEEVSRLYDLGKR